MVPAMNLIQVDVVGAQAFEAGVDLPQDVFARQTDVVWTVAHLSEHLGRNYNLLALGKILERTTQYFLAGAVGIDIGGVEEINSQFERAFDERSALNFVQCPWPAFGFGA